MDFTNKTVLITGASRGIGAESARAFAAKGANVALLARGKDAIEALSAEIGATAIALPCDVASYTDVAAAVQTSVDTFGGLDVLINNAGVLKTPQTITAGGYDIRFVVNTIAPYLLAKRLLPMMDGAGRIVNLSSAAQAPVDLSALAGKTRLGDMPAYSQSKLAITMWSRIMAESLPNGPLVVSVNPGSLLATNMVKEGFGISGNDIGIGSGILRRAALSDEFEGKSGAYFDNDAGDFGPPHPDAMDDVKAKAVVAAIEAVLAGAGV